MSIRRKLALILGCRSLRQNERLSMPCNGMPSRSAPVAAFTWAYNRNCPSGDQLSGTARVLFLTSNSSGHWPVRGVSLLGVVASAEDKLAGGRELARG